MVINGSGLRFIVLMLKIGVLYGGILFIVGIGLLGIIFNVIKLS